MCLWCVFAFVLVFLRKGRTLRSGGRGRIGECLEGHNLAPPAPFDHPWVLQETLKRMGEKIEVHASKWEGDSSIPVISRRMEPSSLGDG